MEHITLEEYKQLQQKGNSKYKAKKTEVDGIKFDSQKEANRYLDLLVLQRAGLIQDLHRQVKFELQPSYKKNGKTIRPIYYVADFVYYDTFKGQKIVEDTKGYRTEIYKLKKKLFEIRYPELEIKEV
ncbi:MAG TPA: hypothetical protein DEP51_04065 [Clostridiales bacterium]|nr:hypothetical protein [Clostridiales bacterium]